MNSRGRYQRFRAPQADGEVLCVPPQDRIPSLALTNRQSLQQRQLEIAGVSLVELADQAKNEILQLAYRYSRTYADVSANLQSQGPLILTGHQPEFVHPGVWLKCFAAARLARELHGLAVNLIIDSDLCRQVSVKVPSGTVQHPGTSRVPFDRDHHEAPYEGRAIVDPDTWNSFGARVSETISPFVKAPLISRWWDSVVLHSRQTNTLGLAIAQARHRLELEWGLANLELPQSSVCQTESFRRFTVALLREAERFRQAYNDSLAEYRVIHQLRNAAQPLPDLARSEDWIETPFWVWRDSEPTRHPLFAKSVGEGLLLGNQRDWQATLPIQTADSAIEQLSAWESEGIKIRSRALTTTLFTRLLVADLFIHGIGGAKYDQVTDDICERFWGVSLPDYLTISGTLRLPIEHPTASQEDIRSAKQKLRELTYHPERFLSEQSVPESDRQQVDQLVTEKIQWIKYTKTPQNAAERHRIIASANENLQEWLHPLRAETQHLLTKQTTQMRANLILESREYPFCLFPQQQLQSFLLDF